MRTLPPAFIVTKLCLVAIFIKFYYSVRNCPCAFAASAAVGAAIADVVRAIP
jgi:hypothetical protein